MEDRCISACQEKERLGITHGWCATCVRELQDRMRAITGERDLLRVALVGLVGVDGRADLEQMEVVMRAMVAPAKDKAATVDAIHALLATVE